MTTPAPTFVFTLQHSCNHTVVILVTKTSLFDHRLVFECIGRWNEFKATPNNNLQLNVCQLVLAVAAIPTEVECFVSMHINAGALRVEENIQQCKIQKCNSYLGDMPALKAALTSMSPRRGHGDVR